jgi:hypothetical protein
MNAVAEFADSLADCRSPAQFYRARIVAENVLTPREFLDLAKGAQRFSAEIRRWLDDIQGSMVRERAEIQDFARHAISSPCVDLFSADRGRREGKSLLLHFCGLNPFRPLALPAAIFLQFIDASQYDVAVLRDPLGCCFLGGMTGYASGFGEMLDKLASDLCIEQYGALRSTGHSAGGYAALCAGAIFGAQYSIAFGGGHPARMIRSERLQQAGLDGNEIDEVLAKRRTHQAAMELNVIAQGSARDHELARTSFELFPSLRNLMIEDYDSHQIAVEALRRGALAPLLRKTLLRPDEPGSGIPVGAARA